MKPMVRYSMNFPGKCQAASAFFTGLSFFLIVVYYYVLGHLESVQGSDIVWRIYAPMVLLGLYMLLSRLIKLDILLVYSCYALLYCGNVTAINFMSQGPQWLNVTETVLYVLCCAALIVSALGYIPGKWYIAAVFFLCAAGRFYFRNFLGYFSPVDLEAALPDASWISGVLSLCFLCAGLKGRPVKKRNAERV